MAVAAILDFQNSKFSTIDSFKKSNCVAVPNLVEIGGTVVDIPYGDFSRWRPFAILDLLCGWLDHARRPFGGLYYCAKSGWKRCSGFNNMQVLVFCDFGWKMPVHAPFLVGGLGHIFPKNVTHRLNTKYRPWAEPRHLSHKAWISAARFELGVWIRKKYRTGKKVTKGLYIFTYLGRSPTVAIYIKNCVVSDVVDVITCVKFQNEIFRGYDFTGGQIFPFSYWFLNGPYNSAALVPCTAVRRYCAACDVWHTILSCLGWVRWPWS